MPTIRLGDLIEEIENRLNHFVSLPQPALAAVVACWIANTYSYEEFRYCGYLALRSVTPQCGKTKLLRLIGAFAIGNPKVTTFPTAAVLYRCGRKVLLIDEVDRLRNQDRDLYGAMLAVLNSGFEEGGTIERNERISTSRHGTVTNGFEVRPYSIYGPKAFAGIDALADTLADRTFAIEMVRSPLRTPRLNMRLMDTSLGETRAKLDQWAQTNKEKIQAAYRNLPDELPELISFDDRFQDISEPLVILAALADTERQDRPPILPRLLEGLRVAAGQRAPSGRERRLLRFLEIVKRVLTDGDEEVFIPTASLLEQCQNEVDLAWMENGAVLGRFLGKFDLSPRRSTDGQRRGYLIRRDWLQRWEDAYGGRAHESAPEGSSNPILPQPSVEVSESQASGEDSPLGQMSEPQTVLTA
jgi:hypothetical protein